MSPRFWARALTLSMLLTSSAAFAEDSYRGVILPMEGYKGTRLRRAILRKVNRIIKLTKKSEAIEAASDLGLDLESPGGVRAICEELDLSLVIRGEIDGEGKDAETTIQIYGPKGKLLASADGGSPHSRRGRAKLARKAANAVHEALNALEDSDEDEDEAPEEPPAPVRKAPVRKAPVRVALSAENSGPVRPAPVVKKVARPKRKRTARAVPKDELKAKTELEAPRTPSGRRILEVAAGLTMRNRSAQVALSSGRNARHNSGMYPEASVLLSAQPLSGALSGAMLQFEAATAVGVASEEPGVQAVNTSAWRVFGGVAYLFSFGPLDVGGGVGMGLDRYAFADNAVMDSRAFTFLRASALGRVKIGDHLSARARAGVRPVFSTGGFGARYAQTSSAFGFDVGGGVYGTFDNGFTYGVQADFVSYNLGFSEAQDGPPAVAESGSDRGWGATLVLGWTLL